MAITAFKECRWYSFYVLVMMMLAYTMNQVDRYLLGVMSKPMAQDIHFGEQSCMDNETLTELQLQNVSCNSRYIAVCVNITNYNGTNVCKWDYDGQGLEYQIIAGPVFILIYTFMGIAVAVLSDLYNRKVMLAVSLMFWSVMTILTGYVQTYWQLVLVRLALGLGEAGCGPFAATILTDYFSVSLRGKALGFYNWGIYLGYSIAFIIGNFVTQANILGQGWRWSFIIPGIPGILIGGIILLSVKEPERQKDPYDKKQEELTKSLGGRIKYNLKPFASWSLLCLFLGGSARIGAGYAFVYNAQTYFMSLGMSREEIGKWFSWVPIVAGSLSLIIGGLIADYLVRRRGLYARVMVLACSQLLGAPFAAASLYFDPPWAIIFQIPAAVISEMWVSVTLTVVVELVPPRVRSVAVGLYVFVISNIGGNLPLLVPTLRAYFTKQGLDKVASLRGALYILYAGMYVIAGFLYLLTMFVVKRDQKKNEARVLELQNKDDEMTTDAEFAQINEKVPTKDEKSNGTEEDKIKKRE